MTRQGRAKARTGCYLLAAALAGGIHGTAPASSVKDTSSQKNLPIGKEDPFREKLAKNYKPTDLVCLSPELGYQNGRKLELRSEAAKSLEQMAQEAAAKGLNLKVVSAYRDFAHQNRLYESAIKRYGKNQKMVGRPGRSEHFLGTTVDVTNKNPKHLLKAQFADSAEYRWLEANAEKYGWQFTVRAGKNGRKASQDEPWHLRYFGEATKSPGTDSVASDRAVASVSPAIEETKAKVAVAGALVELAGQVRQVRERLAALKPLRQLASELKGVKSRLAVSSPGNA